MSIYGIAGIASGVSLLALGAAVSPAFVATRLSKTDTVFTRVPEGTVKAIMRGASFERLVMSFKGYHLNDPGESWYDQSIPAWEVLSHGQNEDTKYDSRPAFMRQAGVYFVGFLPSFTSVKRYQFSWTEPKLDLKTNKQISWSRDEETDFIYVSNFPYIMNLSGAECADGIPLDVKFQVVLRVTNPYKALFDTENWHETVVGEILRLGRDFVGSRTYKELLSETPKGKTDNTGTTVDDGESFSCKIVKLTNELPDDRSDADTHEKGLSGNYGVTVVTVNVEEVEISGENKAQYQQTTLKAYTAEQDAIAIERAADAAAYSTRVQANADADAKLLKSKAKARATLQIGIAESMVLTRRLRALDQFKDLGKLVAQVDAMKADGPGKTIIWANSPFIQSHQGLAGLLSACNIQSADDLKRFIDENLKGPANGQIAS